MTELTTAPTGAPLADGDIFLVRKADAPGATQVTAAEAAEYFGTASEGGSGGGSGGGVPAQTEFKFWRVRCFDSFSNAFCAVELAFRSQVGGANVAVGGTPISSNEEFGADTNAFDSNAGSFWGTSSVAGRWIGYEFPAAVKIKEIAWTARTSGEATQTPRHWTVDASDDGIAWRDIWSGDFNDFASGETKVRANTLSAEVGGGGGGSSDPAVLMPHAADLISLNIGAGHSIIETYRGVSVQLTGDVGLSGLGKPVTAGADFIFTVCMETMRLVSAASYGVMGLMLRNSTNSKIATFTVNYDTNESGFDSYFWSNYTIYSSGGMPNLKGRRVAPSGFKWWRLRRVGGTVFYEVSVNAVHWAVVGSNTNIIQFLGDVDQAASFIPSDGILEIISMKVE
jgi:hypothetical protein